MNQKAVILLAIVLSSVSSVHAQACDFDVQCDLATCKDGPDYRDKVCHQGACVPLVFDDDPCGSAYSGVEGEIISDALPDLQLLFPTGLLSGNVSLRGPSGPVAISKTGGSGSVHVYTPSSALEKGKHTLTVNATNGAMQLNAQTKVFTIKMLDLVISMAAPRLGAASSTPFEVSMWTARPASCRYFMFFQQKYDLMPPFDTSGDQEHTLNNYAAALDKTPIFVKCNDSFTNKIEQAQFVLLKDESAPIISQAYANPELVSDFPLATTLTITTDDEVVCKYDTSAVGYDSLTNLFKNDNPNDPATYGRDKTHTVASLVDGIMYELYVACKNIAGLTSPTKPISFRVNSSLEGKIMNITPRTGDFFIDSSLKIQVHTNKNALCWYGNSSDPEDFSGTFGTPGKVHISDPQSFKNGVHTVHVLCAFDQGQHEKRADTTFIVDDSPPEKPTIDDSTDFPGDPEITFETNKLLATFSAVDDESGIVAYNYTIETGGTRLFNWRTTKSKHVIATGINLSHGKTYTFVVKAQNGVGLWSLEGRSDGVRVDLSKSPLSCDNSIKDNNESDVDCGGNCKRCETNKKCKAARDCRSLYCSSGGVCLEPSCEDNVKNQGETDVDCGGGVCGRCDIGDECTHSTDCASTNCLEGICLKEDTCSNNEMNFGETDVDCGGICAEIKDHRCGLGMKCEDDRDCDTDLACGISDRCIEGSDRDEDGVHNTDDNCPNTPNPDQNDFDKDGVGDECDKDDDNDGMDDDFEIEYGLNPLNANDAMGDSDLDGLTNVMEARLGTNPLSEDSDGDGHSDLEEVDKQTDPTSALSNPGGGLLGKILILLAALGIGGGALMVYKKYKARVAALETESIEPIAETPIPDKPRQPVPQEPIAPGPRKKYRGKRVHKDVFKEFSSDEHEEPEKNELTEEEKHEDLMKRIEDIPDLPADELFERLKKEIDDKK